MGKILKTFTIFIFICLLLGSIIYFIAIVIDTKIKITAYGSIGNNTETISIMVVSKQDIRIIRKTVVENEILGGIYNKKLFEIDVNDDETVVIKTGRTVATAGQDDNVIVTIKQGIIDITNQLMYMGFSHTNENHYKDDKTRDDIVKSGKLNWGGYYLI